MFYELMRALRERVGIERAGFYVAHHPMFETFRRNYPEFGSGGYEVLKEWEITARADAGEPDLDLIARYEKKLGCPSLWGALVADRRIWLGEKCTYRLDYRPRFTHRQMLNILQAALVEMEALFDRVRPDFATSFICVTFGEFLAHLFARSRGIPFLNLRPTRIKNFVTYGDSVFEPSGRIRDSFENYLNGGGEDEWTKESREYIDFVHGGHALYEGVAVPEKAASAGAPAPTAAKIARLVRNESRRRFGEIRDNHDPGVLQPLLYKRFLNPLQNWWNDKNLSGAYVREEELPSMDYVFFPLHTEPEVTLLVYSKPYLNQIEVIRNIAHSLPVNMKIVVKDHPAAAGKRPLGYYKKILDVPNARLAPPSMGSKPLIQNSRMVSTISGGIGWEAVLRKKPVLIFGHAPYEILPETMVRRVADPDRLPEDIACLLGGYAYDERAAVSYVAAAMKESVAVDFYSKLLGRQGVYELEEGGADMDETMRKEVGKLADYTVASLKR